MALAAGSRPETRKEAARGDADSAFLEQLGKRVRRARGQRGLSRKILAQYAGVSERYLAQLETGQGNISIILLRHVAAALDLSLEALVADDPEAAAEIAVILHLLRRATPEERGLAKELLTQRQNGRDGDDSVSRVALIGLRGAGKSTLGRLLAEDLAVPFVELNHEIAKISGLDVPEIFSLYGPEGYRRLERRCLQNLVDRQERFVLASGGGIVADPSTYDLLLSSFFTVWLRTTPEEHMERVRAQGDLRPMAGHDEAMAELKLILDSREALYARADRELDTAGREIQACRRDLARLVREEVWAEA